MDGVLVDGEPLHFRAVNELLAEEKKSMPFEYFKGSMGTKGSWSDLIRAFDLREAPATYAFRYDRIIQASYERESVALPGAVAVVRGLAKAMPIAVASSSRTAWVHACLRQMDLLDAFATVVTGSDVERGKPAPDIYLLAAERLGVAPEECLAIEDAPAGISAAKAAGMRCWAVRTEYTRGLTLPDPDREFDSLVDIDLREIVGVPE